MRSIPGDLKEILSRVHRAKRRQLSKSRRWFKQTRNFLHISLLLFIPLLIGLVTFLANAIDFLPYLLFPPLASGTYTLFADPEARAASPRRFVGGMTIGAICGWIALTLTAQYWYEVSPEVFQVHPGAAAFGVLLTGILTWSLDLEAPQAFSTALLVLVSGTTQLIYVVSVFVSSTIVASMFVLWEREIYEQRGKYLYQTQHGDDNVLVPIRGDALESVAVFGARLAAAHEAGKVVLLAAVSSTEATETATDEDEVTCQESRIENGEAVPTAACETARKLEELAESITARFDVPCDIVVVAGDTDDPAQILQTARERNCDLIVTQYEEENGKLSSYVRRLFASTLDVIVVNINDERTEWRRILVPVRSPSGVAHAMLDFATRLTGEEGQVSICHCTDMEEKRRDGEEMLANLAKMFERAFETRVATVPISTFLEENAEVYDLTIIGSSTDRTKVSRFINPPTFKRLEDIECDVAIVHRGSG